MLGSLLKKKIDVNRFANVFVNSLVEATDAGFKDVSDMINEDTAFVSNPLISSDQADHFLMIVVAGNLKYLDARFQPEDSREIRTKIVQKLAEVYRLEPHKIEGIVKHYDDFISKVNHPSKNTLYGMSKALFHKLGLNEHQESYFKNLKTPNPLFLKRMDDMLSNFLWDWDEFFRKYRTSLN
jgi:hypothetical protein